MIKASRAVDPNQRYKAVFFDADDTLFDYPTAERNAFALCAKEWGIAGEEESLLEIYRKHNHAVWQAFERGEMDQERLRTERFRLLLAELAQPPDSIEQISASYLAHLSRQPHLLDDAYAVINGLSQRYKLAIITNGIASVQRSRFSLTPITKYFTSIVISEEVGVVKPDPKIFETALMQLQVHVKDVLYVGDSVTSDMAAARNAGMDFCWYNPAGVPVPDGFAPRFIIGRLLELVDFLLCD